MKKILIVITFPGPAEAFVPVIEKLKRQYICRIFGVSKGQAWGGLGGSYSVLKEYFDETMDLSEIVPSEDDIERFLRHESPDLILLGAVNDVNGDRCFPEKYIISSSIKAGINTVQYVCDWFSWSKNSRHADHVFVMDELSVRTGEYITGSEPKNVYYCGHTGLERFFKNTEYEYSPGKNVICYFTQPNADTHKVIGWLSATMTSDKKLIIKKHPRDVASYKEELGQFSCDVEISDKTPEDIFADIDQVLTHTSVVGLKSVLCGIPVINIMPEASLGGVYGYLGGYPLALAGFTREVSSIDGLKKAIEDPLRIDMKKVVKYFDLNNACSLFVKGINNIV